MGSRVEQIGRNPALYGAVMFGLDTVTALAGLLAALSAATALTVAHHHRRMA